MSKHVHEYTKGRSVEVAPNTMMYEPSLDFTDGYRVTVGWSDEDDAWIAECSGMATGDCLAHGYSREAALLSLACALAATVDAVNPASTPEQPAPSVSPVSSGEAD